MGHIRSLGFDNVYVINLERRTDRLLRLQDNLSRLYYKIVPAVDGKTIDIPKLIDEKVLSDKFYDPNGILTRGVLGCAISHYNAWQAFLKSNEETALILEDDIFFNGIFENIFGSQIQFTPKYITILEELNALDWDMFFLGKKGIDIVTENPFANVSVPLYGKSGWGAHAYAINRKMAMKLSEKYLPINIAVDIFLEKFLFDDDCKIYSVNTSLIQQYSDGVVWTQTDSDTYKNIVSDANRDGKYVFIEPYVESVKVPDENNDMFELTLKTI